MNIRKKIQFCPVAPCSNDRGVFASMLQVFIASMNKRKQHFWLTEDFICPQAALHLPDRAPYRKRYGMFCKGKHIVPLKNIVLLNPSTASLRFEGPQHASHKSSLKIWKNVAFLEEVVACLYATFFYRGNNIPLRKCKARPWDVHSIPLEQVRSVFHIF